LKREIITTSDGSKTIFLPEWNEHYHSKHGAIQEAYHVFIKQGLYHFCHSEPKKSVSILEIGFGTGLNAFITLLEAENLGIYIDYVGIEAFPVEVNEILQLNYPTQLSVEDKTDIFNKIHDVSWDENHVITHNFKLKIK
jgi:tRNA U34 5-methylaminomethyl-2-thiouridine-forming methyltransferase MnmC